MIENGEKKLTADKPPFPFFGGKSRIVARVWRAFGDVPNYVEPFAGSLAVLLSRPSTPQTETVNDLDRFIANFFRAVQHDPSAVAEAADWPVNECVPAGTMIETPNGRIPVESIKPGMTVYGFNGQMIVNTQVLATRESVTDKPLVRVGPLSLTPNHPVWTESGYVAAGELDSSARIGLFPTDRGVDETDLQVVKCAYGNSLLADLHVDRSTHESRSLCWGNAAISEATPNRTLVEILTWGQNTPGLLDTVAGQSGREAFHDSHRTRQRRRLARPGTILDCGIPQDLRSGESHRWRRGNYRIQDERGTEAESLSEAIGKEISSGPQIGNARKAPHARSDSKDSADGSGTPSYGRIKAEALRQTHWQDPIGSTSEKAVRSPSREGLVGYAPTEYCGIHYGPEGCPGYGNRNGVRFNHRSGSLLFRHRGQHLSGDSQGLPLQRTPSSPPVATPVYNFQTTTENYFANRVLVHNCDLEARHFWLITEGRKRTEALLTDPEAFDAQVAGWWVWGQACWIGSGWCSGEGPWVVGEDGWTMRNPGKGVNRQLPHLRNPGKGVNRQLPHLRNPGQGVNRQLPHLRNPGQGHPHRAHLIAYMTKLAHRLRYVRVACGDWTRVLTPSITDRFGLTAVFLDPPYGEGEVDYAAGGNRTDIADAVREWAIEHAENRNLRIALCGYDGQHDMPPDWQCIEWKAAGGYSSTAANDTQGKANRHRERIWFSPHCVGKAKTLFE